MPGNYPGASSAEYKGLGVFPEGFAPGVSSPDNDRDLYENTVACTHFLALIAHTLMETISKHHRQEINLNASLVQDCMPIDIVIQYF